MIAPDSSVLIAGYLPGHQFHALAASALAGVRRSGRLLAHTMAETYAVLTAPAGPFVVPGESVLRYLGQFLSQAPHWLSPGAYATALAELARAGIEGGGIYDGLVAIAARDLGSQLISLDRRARPAYEKLGTDFRLLV